MRLQKKANLEKSLDVDRFETVISSSGESYLVPKQHAHEVTPESLDRLEEAEKSIEDGKGTELPDEWYED